MSALGTVAVIGYGNQGRAHALNLRDSGELVVVGARDGAGSRRAADDGFAALAIASAVAKADVVSLLLPDEVAADVYERAIAPHLRAAGAVIVAHGSAVTFGDLTPDPSIDVCLVAPTGPGVELRSRFESGGGIPAVWAVHRNATGNARSIALAYADGLGCTRAGLFETDVRDESVIDLFGEQAVLCGSLAALVTKGFRALVDAGYSPELAYVECVHQLKLTSSLISEYGVDGMWDHVSRTARFGGLEAGRSIVGPETDDAMRAVLARIESGAFFADFIADTRAGGPILAELRAGARDEELERTGSRVRAIADSGAPNGGQNKS